MINSVNTVDFSSTNSDNLLPPEMVPSEKFNSTQHSTSRIPQNSVRLNSHYTELLSQYVCKGDYSGAPDNCASTTSATTTKTKEIVSHLNATVQQQERVKVQHLQTHSKLQNNRWNYHTLYDICAEETAERRDIISKKSSSSNIQNDSALISCYQMDDKYTTSVGMENNNNNNNDNERNSLEMSKAITGGSMVMSDRRASPIQRTEDQENAFRRIEDVHNYAKLNRFSYSNESSRSTVHEYENEEEEEDEMEDDDDNDVEDDADNPDDLPATYESYFNNRKSPYSMGNFNPHSGGEKRIKLNRVTVEESDTHVDVETVHKELGGTELAVVNTPDHHARRPMNAFLIFCKRHRAIVKERYKSLENRAITKILGDWWASLDVSDKKCFTNLAQQNKDAFFSANPNFKWYKLPAPPLRTLNTRPSNTERTSEHEPEDDCSRATIHSSIKQGEGNFFKFADEAQMGELSTLMSDKGSVAQCALQQVLGETSQFLNTHIPHSLDRANDARGDAQSSKGRLHCENSFSSNSSEEDAVPKKSSRSCKGKIYQELIQSGQILAIAKKVKQPKSQLSCPNDYTTRQGTAHHQHQHAAATANESPIVTTLISDGKDTAVKRTASESESMQQHYDLANFDLEEKIKELPALSLDTYLQRKRNTKKKKKFSSKKRNSNSVSSNKSYASVATTPSPPVTPSKEAREPPQQIVGSQKRKARKESITRRDVSAIENEVASIISSTDFNTINGCYYFNEAPLLLSKTPTAAAVTAATTSTTVMPIAASANCVPSSCTTSSTIDQFSSVFSNDNISSTSDLLILAEVAANRTELTN